MIILTPTRPLPAAPGQCPTPHPARYRPSSWQPAAAPVTAGLGPGVLPGKGTRRPPNGGVLPPQPGWGGKNGTGQKR